MSTQLPEEYKGMATIKQMRIQYLIKLLYNISIKKQTETRRNEWKNEKISKLDHDK